MYHKDAGLGFPPDCLIDYLTRMSDQLFWGCWFDCLTGCYIDCLAGFLNLVVDRDARLCNELGCWIDRLIGVLDHLFHGDADFTV